MSPFMPLLVTLALCSSTQAQADRAWKLTLGYDHSQGDYGQSEPTTITSTPLSLGWRSPNWSVKLATSYIHMQGPDSVVIADGATSTGTGSGTTAEVQALGDSYLTLKRSFDTGRDAGLFLDLSSKVKLPTGDTDKGLSTGEIDVTVQFDLALWRGDWMPLATLGYRVPGQSDSYAPEPVWLGTLGLQYSRSKAHSIGALYDYRQPYTSGSDPLSELMLYSSHRLSGGDSVTLYATTGFTDNSVGAGGGIQYSIALGGSSSGG